MNKEGLMTDFDQDRYSRYWDDKAQEWDARCSQCGSCCGSLEDPCENLQQRQSGVYACRVYENRFGPRRTLSGKEFVCVPIRDKIAAGHSWPGDDHCAYKNAVT